MNDFSAAGESNGGNFGIFRGDYCPTYRIRPFRMLDGVGDQRFACNRKDILTWKSLRSTTCRNNSYNSHDGSDLRDPPKPGHDRQLTVVNPFDTVSQLAFVHPNVSNQPFKSL